MTKVARKIIITNPDVIILDCVRDYLGFFDFQPIYPGFENLSAEIILDFARIKIEMTKVARKIIIANPARIILDYERDYLGFFHFKPGFAARRGFWKLILDFSKNDYLGLEELFWFFMIFGFNPGLRKIISDNLF